MEKALTGNRSEMDISMLAPGVYMVKISNGRNSEMCKLIKE